MSTLHAAEVMAHTRCDWQHNNPNGTVSGVAYFEFYLWRGDMALRHAIVCGCICRQGDMLKGEARARADVVQVFHEVMAGPLRHFVSNRLANNRVGIIFRPPHHEPRRTDFYGRVL